MNYKYRESSYKNLDNTYIFQYGYLKFFYQYIFFLNQVVKYFNDFHNSFHSLIIPNVFFVFFFNVPFIKGRDISLVCPLTCHKLFVLHSSKIELLARKSHSIQIGLYKFSLILGTDSYSVSFFHFLLGLIRKINFFFFLYQQVFKFLLF